MCNSGSLLHNLQIYPRPRRNFLLTSPFFRETRTLPAAEQCESTVYTEEHVLGTDRCSVKPGQVQVHEGNLSKQKGSQRVRRRKDYVNKKFRRGPTHPRVAHSCLSTLGSMLQHSYKNLINGKIVPQRKIILCGSCVAPLEVKYRRRVDPSMTFRTGLD